MDSMNKRDNIKSKADFVNFVEFLAEDSKINPQEWENKTVSDFLEAMASWTQDMEGYYINHNLPIPENVNWKVMAEILTAAKVYE